MIQVQQTTVKAVREYPVCSCGGEVTTGLFGLDKDGWPWYEYQCVLYKDIKRYSMEYPKLKEIPCPS